MSRERSVCACLSALLCFGWAITAAAAAAQSLPQSASTPNPTPSVAPAPPAAGATTPVAAGAAPAAPSVLTPADLPEVIVERDEPRFVAPNRRDRIGRIWAPVLIDGKGPYRMVLDTGASHSAITQRAANVLNLPLADDLTLVTGVTGSATVQSLRVERMEVGELLLGPTFLPIVPNVFAGADGVLGREGLANMRIYADFAHDRLTITRSRNQHAGYGYSVVPLRVTPDGLLVASAIVGRVPCRAIIDTGAQRTVGNEALRLAALRNPSPRARREEVVGVTLDVQTGDNEPTPPIFLDKVTLTNVRVTFGDMYLFDHWHMTGQPTLLIGMDVLGSFEALVIDYRTRELQLLVHNASPMGTENTQAIAPGEYRPF